MEPVDRMCPSTPAGNATVFLGMITPMGKVAYITPEVPAETVLSGMDDSAGPLEASYRFAGPCVTSRCGFWTGEHCGLGATLVESYQASGGEEVDLPKCAIRRNCRWFAEQGPAACSPCSYVVTDAR
ncbi:hypothetical protein F4553_001726 [Allocatelliglobosispora scoriae]|uniref:Nitrogen fixation protein n=1 Tax=Allocatelliglobosispora scoriae TaxID=643052 RepID=A0A841BGY6_9ACTN|nr:hypothetical protein [Allocatelliglobosispora scoriae]MBB5868347.1 hypothetical protein [Allocatelliglobosispora scoriae]